MTNHELIVVYDVSTTTPEGRKRLRHVARICEAYGQRVQKSVFELVVSDADRVRLIGRLLDVIDVNLDSLRCYTLTAGTLERCLTEGRPAAIMGHQDAWVL